MNGLPAVAGRGAVPGGVVVFVNCGWEGLVCDLFPTRTQEQPLAKYGVLEWTGGSF